MSESAGSIEPIEILHLASDVVAAYAGNNTVRADQLPGLLQDVAAALSALAAGNLAFASNCEPAVPINKSITPDHVICLEDGKKLKMLKRYIRTHYNLTPEEYRRKWNLPADYPMVAPNYAKRRSQFAKDIGLGTSTTKKRKTAAKKKSVTRKRRIR